MRLCGGALGVILIARIAAAQGHDSATAQAMFDQAREAMSRADYPRACAKFAESHRIDPMPGTLANLAVCEDKRGALASAWTHARDAIEQLGPTDDRVPLLRGIVARTQKRLPRLVVRLAPGSPRETRVRRDDVELGDASLGEALPVDPGEHTVIVRSPGRADATQTVNVAEGQTVQVEATPGDPVVATLSSGPERARREDSPQPATQGSRSTLGYVIGGVGVVSLSVAAVTGIVLLGKQSDVRAANCDRGSGVCTGPSATDGTRAASSGSSLLPVYYVSLATGALAVGAGAYLLLTSPRGTTVALRIAPDGGSVAVTF